MADNLMARGNAGSGTDVLATDEIAGVHYPRTKLVIGADGVNGGDVSGANPLPVLGPLTDAQLRASSVPVSGPLTDAQLRASALKSSVADLAASTYNVAGVIAINTDLLVIDCLNLRQVYIQCTSMGTTGVVTPAWSNDNTNFVAASIMTPAGVAAATFNAAGLWSTPVYGRYLRLRLTTATTAGTTTINVQGSDRPGGQPVAQPVSGSVTVSGSLTSAGTTTATPATPTASIINSAASTNGTVVKGTAGTLYSVTASNINAAVRYLKLYNSATVTVGTTTPAITIAIPAGGAISYDLGAVGMRFGAGICLAMTTGAADSDVGAVAANEIKSMVSFI